MSLFFNRSICLYKTLFMIYAYKMCVMFPKHVMIWHHMLHEMVPLCEIYPLMYHLTERKGWRWIVVIINQINVGLMYKYIEIDIYVYTYIWYPQKYHSLCTFSLSSNLYQIKCHIYSVLLHIKSCPQFTMHVHVHVIHLSEFITDECINKVSLLLVGSINQVFNIFHFIYSTLPMKLGNSCGVFCLDMIVCLCPHGPLARYV